MATSANAAAATTARQQQQPSSIEVSVEAGAVGGTTPPNYTTTAAATTITTLLPSPTNAVDSVLDEISDLLQAASESQSLGRLRNSYSCLLLAHQRLVGLGRRVDRSFCQVEREEDTTTTTVEDENNNVSANDNYDDVKLNSCDMPFSHHPPTTAIQHKAHYNYFVISIAPCSFSSSSITTTDSPTSPPCCHYSCIRRRRRRSFNVLLKHKQQLQHNQ